MPDAGSICFADSLDAATLIGFAASGGSPIVMNKIFRRLAPAFLVLIFSCFALGDDFKSITFNSTTPATDTTIRVHADQFMVIRNFTQENQHQPAWRCDGGRSSGYSCAYVHANWNCNLHPDSYSNADANWNAISNSITNAATTCGAHRIDCQSQLFAGTNKTSRG
jgi:hypothetical protein